MSVPFSSLHHQVLRLLPWYVRGRLEGEEARRVEAHLSVCSTCRGEAESLSRMFHVHEMSSPQPEVNEEQLERLLARIDRFEQQRPQSRPMGRTTSAIEALTAAVADVFGYLTKPPALVAIGLFATSILGVLVSIMSHAPPAEPSYDVLSSPDQTAEFRIRLRFHADATPDDVRQLVSSSLGTEATNGAYRIERRSEREFVVVLGRKPNVVALSQWLNDWSSAPNVAAASIDSDNR